MIQILDGDPVKVLSVITPPAIGTAVLVDPYTIRYTPTPYAAGTDTFTYQVYDRHRHTATAQVTVNILNHPPVAVADVCQTNSSTPININVVANDTDPNRTPSRFRQRLCFRRLPRVQPSPI